jgi:hypothetical protein
MVSNEYLNTARALFRIAKDMTDETIAARLKALAEDYERRAQKASDAESTKASSPLPARGACAGRAPG